MEVLSSLDSSSELWLIQVPAGVDVQSLDGLRVRAGRSGDGELRMQGPAGSFAWADVEQPVSSVCLLPTAAGPSGAAGPQGRLKPAPAFSRQVVLYRTDEEQGTPSRTHVSAPKALLAQPQGMRVRFRPSGDTVRPCRAGGLKKGKKANSAAVDLDLTAPEEETAANGGKEEQRPKKRKHREIEGPAAGDGAAHPLHAADDAEMVDAEARAAKKKEKKDKKRARESGAVAAATGGPSAAEEEERRKRKQEKRDKKANA
ncbi:hypothetical protein T492DRAFT_1110425 [Pavlovales sp. CCMP2436]|nr:hypothetical protein T492DRAFT_1110425 [Pavlovales sp. CCMP2436]|mmetsp:Transcript_423/g.1197  ORF Transcript_423/g.1197 Transcript_423/m.1197 type:complete len:258 (+) Transcript_423:48-821(+)